MSRWFIELSSAHVWQVTGAISAVQSFSLELHRLRWHHLSFFIFLLLLLLLPVGSSLCTLPFFHCVELRAWTQTHAVVFSCLLFSLRVCVCVCSTHHAIGRMVAQSSDCGRSVTMSSRWPDVYHLPPGPGWEYPPPTERWPPTADTLYGARSVLIPSRALMDEFLLSLCCSAVVVLFTRSWRWWWWWYNCARIVHCPRLSPSKQ